jgi:Iap family predicted aminopeptidase
MIFFLNRPKALLLTAYAVLFVALKAQIPINEKRITRIKNDITYLASDALEGRQTGSPGEKLSADYIAGQMKEAGLKPLKSEWFQTFDIVKLRIAKPSCLLAFISPTGEAMELKLHEDFYPISQSGNADSAEGAVIDCGYGIVMRDSTNRDDFAASGDLKGNIAVIRLGFAGDSDNPHSPLSVVANISTKIREAIAHGAAGILFLPGSTAAEVPKGELERYVKTLDIPIFYLKKPFKGEFPRGVRMQMKSHIAVFKATAHNVAGVAGKYKRNRNNIIVCAHHDHLGFNEYGGSRYTGPQAIHNGADDNASGVAAMLELSRSLKGMKYKKNNLVFVAFSGEELGLLGSKHFVQQCPVPKQKISYVINIDMLGRLDEKGKTLMVNGVGTSPVWKTTLSSIKTDTNIIRIATTESGLGPSDHASFYLEGIPVLHFFTGQHEDYHKPSDDVDKINFAGMDAAVDVIEQIIAANTGKKKPAFTKTKDATPGRSNFKVTLGVMPDYTYSGNGMKLDGVTEGRPAMKAGLQRGDIITKVGEISIGSVTDYMNALSKFEKGQKAEVSYLREGKTLTTTVEF